MRAALFDMDRTLVRRETASLYVRYQRRQGEASLRDMARVSYWVAKYTLGILDHEQVATLAATSLRGEHEDTMIARCLAWVESDVAKHISEVGRRVVDRHRAAGDLLAIVTGASPYAARPVAQRLGIDIVVASELERDPGGFFTGRFEPPLCIGEGKVTRAQRLAEAHGFRLEDAIFYTDSVTDLPLMERVREPVAVNPDMRLRRLARARGWRIERW